MNNTEIFEMADRLKALQERKKNLEAEAKAMGAEISALDAALSDAMAEAELDRFSRGGSTFYLKSRLFASPAAGRKDEMMRALKAQASEYRRCHPAKRQDIGCLTTKIKCAHCGCNFRKATQRSVASETGKRSYWRCAEHKGCGTVGLREDLLMPFIAETLGLAEFDDGEFDRRIDYIEVLSASEMVFHFKDGRIVSRAWEQPKQEGKLWTEAQRAKFKESVKQLYTPERRQQISERMKQIRKERGKAWRKEK